MASKNGSKRHRPTMRQVEDLQRRNVALTNQAAHLQQRLDAVKTDAAKGMHSCQEKIDNAATALREATQRINDLEQQLAQKDQYHRDNLETVHQHHAEEMRVISGQVEEIKRDLVQMTSGRPGHMRLMLAGGIRLEIEPGSDPLFGHSLSKTPALQK